MLQQLRIYKVEEGKYDEFLRVWLAGIPRLRQANGWAVQAWAVRESSELVWTLSRDCTVEEWEEKEKEYHSSQARLALNPDPRTYLVSQEHKWLEPLELPTSA
jgi:hypothetical protein